MLFVYLKLLTSRFIRFSFLGRPCSRGGKEFNTNEGLKGFTAI